MRTLRCLLCVVLAVMSPAGIRAQSTEHVAGIDSTRARFLKALATKDTATFRGALTDDAITWFKQGSGGSINTGLPAVMLFYASLFSKVSQSLEMVFTPDAVKLSNATALETGKWRMPGFKTSGAYVTVYRKGADGHWRITFWKAGATLD